jgi:hypothetical protein
MVKKNQKSKPRPASRSSEPPSSDPEGSGAVKDTLPVPAAPEAAGGRRAGVRGAAPWAARHAERRAAEAAARLREPPRPGSARATLRTPDQADQIKQRIMELHTALGRVRALRKNLGENFFDLGVVLKQIVDERLFDAKGYATFEAFVERELDFSKAVAMRLARVPEVFHEPAARRHGMEAVLAALEVLETETKPAPRKATPARGMLPLKPPK